MATIHEAKPQGDGVIVETVRRVDGTLTVFQRWGGMIGTLIIVSFYGGVNYWQFHDMGKDIQELKDQKKKDTEEYSRLRSQVDAQQAFINDYMKVDKIYLDKLRIEREARLQNEEQQRQKARR
jgi:hypothetical protein